MKANFRCENCGKETKVSKGKVSLVCQGCGCFDIKFDHDVIVSPANFGDKSNPQLVKAGESFFGNTKRGQVWDLSFPNPVNNPPPVEEDPKTLKIKIRKK